MTNKKLFLEREREYARKHKRKAFEEEAPLGIELITFNEKKCSRNAMKDFNELKAAIDRDQVNLIFINDLTDQEQADELGNLFGIHPMVMEDALSVAEIPSIQETGDQLLLTMKLIDLKVSGEVYTKHIGLLLGDFYVIVFKDSENKVFDEVRTRIENGKSKARQK